MTRERLLLCAFLAVVVAASVEMPATAQTIDGEDERLLEVKGEAATVADQTDWAELGLPYLSAHYPAQTYGEHPQNWAVTQDARGVVYVANLNGVLEFDGERWRTIPTRTYAFVRSLDTGPDGRVWVGVQGDFGYLAPDSLGVMRYRSLYAEVALGLVDGERRARVEASGLDALASAPPLGDVWATHALKEGVYFQTEEQLFRWDGERMRRWMPEVEVFHTSFAVRDGFYVREIGRGLLRMESGNAEEDSLRLVPGGERFAETPIHMMVPYGEDRVLVGTARGAFYLFDPEAPSADEAWVPFETEATAFIEQSRLYYGCALFGGQYYALATLGGGVVIVSATGEVAQVLGAAGELADAVVNHVFAGRSGELWIALNSNGVARARVPSALSAYGEEQGLSGTINHIARHGGALYAATGSGLYRLDEEAVTPEARGRDARSEFEKVPGVPPSVWSLLSTGDGQLLAATNYGVYAMRGGNVEGPARITEGVSSAVELQASERHPGLVYVSTEEGVSVLRRSGGGAWQKREVYETGAPVRSVWEQPAPATDNGTVLWVADEQGGVTRLAFPGVPGRSGPPRVWRYGLEDGLPESAQLNVGSIEGRFAVVSKWGIYRYRRPEAPPDDASGGVSAFYPDTALSAAGEDHGALLAAVEAPGGSVWLAYERHVDVLRRQGRGGAYVRRTVGPLSFPKAGVVQVFVEEQAPAAGADAQGGADPVVWIGNGRELVRYDAGLAEALAPTEAEPEGRPAMLLRLAASAGGGVLYGGAYPAEEEGGLTVAATRVDHDAAGALAFEYAAPVFSAPAPTRYQHRLARGAGDAGAWSPLSESARAVYDEGLWEGRYRFEVRAVDGWGRALAPAALAFRVLPPWYRTAWAYLLYALALVGTAYAVRRARSRVRRTREQARELQREREARARLEEANRRIDEARERLKEANRRLTEANELKDHFLANTSHELRTPLTAILGFAGVLKEEATRPEERREFAELIRQSGQRLLRTLNDILDIAQLRSGAYKISPRETDVGERAEAAARLFRHMAREKGIYLRTEGTECDGCVAWLDPQRLDSVLQNLVGNAVKFTDEGGITIAVETVATEADAPNAADAAQAPRAGGDGAAGRAPAEAPCQAPGGAVRIEVRDTGRGISKTFMPHLFEEFKQESEGLSRSHEGNGLGLAITKRLVEAMGGVIEAESRKGEGSVFRVTFPAAAPALVDAPEGP